MAFRKYKLNENVFDKITEESAYWIGFLMADGCVSGNNVILALASKDTNHVEKFKEFLGSDMPIRTKTNGANKAFLVSEFRVHSRKLASELSTFGVVPQKSKTAKILKLENNRHFWRGVIDGDGTVSNYKKDNKAFISLIGSENLINQFLEFVKSIVKTNTSPSPCKDSLAAFSITFTNRKAFQIISMLYDDCNIYLDRKYEKALKIKSQYDEINKKKSEIDNLTNKIARLYINGLSGLKIAKKLSVSNSAVYEHLKRYEKLTGETISRRNKTRQIATGKRYRLEGKCKNCGKGVVPNRSRCEIHLTQARNQWREKHGQNLGYRI